MDNLDETISRYVGYCQTQCTVTKRRLVLREFVAETKNESDSFALFILGFANNKQTKIQSPLL